jgi:hypothetical protein
MEQIISSNVTGKGNYLVDRSIVTPKIEKEASYSVGYEESGHILRLEFISKTSSLISVKGKSKTSEFLLPLKMSSTEYVTLGSNWLSSTKINTNPYFSKMIRVQSLEIANPEITRRKIVWLDSQTEPSRLAVLEVQEKTLIMLTAVTAVALTLVSPVLILFTIPAFFYGFLKHKDTNQKLSKLRLSEKEILRVVGLENEVE